MAARRPLGAGVVTLIVVDAVLVLILVILVVQSSPGPATGGDAGSGTATTASGGAKGAVVASPSRNITCTLAQDATTCTIAEFSYATPTLPGCDGTVGHEIRLTADGASWVCGEGEPPGPAAADVEVLDYGESITSAGVTCSSSEQGIACTHEESGHSLSLARGGATLD